MKKIEKSLGGATEPQSFVHKVNGIFGQNFQTLTSGPKKSTRLAKLKQMSNDISNFVKTWVSTKLKFMVECRLAQVCICWLISVNWRKQFDFFLLNQHFTSSRYQTLSQKKKEKEKEKIKN